MARKAKPATNPEAREQRLINKALDLAERKLEDGTAPAQLICMFLKLGSSRERLEKQRLEEENKLLRAKTDAIKNVEDVAKKYDAAIRAMKRYTGQPIDDEYYDEDEWDE